MSGLLIGYAAGLAVATVRRGYATGRRWGDVGDVAFDIAAFALWPMLLLHWVGYHFGSRRTLRELQTPGGRP